MIVRQFLLWARSAPPEHRAEAVAGLAQAYLEGELSPDDRKDAQTALTAMLDDRSSLVRKAIAESLSDSPEAPRPVIIALANDDSEVAAIVLARSPVLMDADLIDCAALGGEQIQSAIARRPYVSVATSAALAEIAAPQALAALAGNPGAEISDASLWRMVERHGFDPALRQVLLQRPDLPLDIRHAVAVAISAQLSAFVQDSGWAAAGRAERTIGDVRDRATIVMAEAAPAGDVRCLVAYLRRTGQLTPALMLRALLSRSLTLVEAAFAELSQLPDGRVAGLLHDRRGTGFAALYDRAGLPTSLKPAFAAAVAALRQRPGSGEAQEAAQLSRVMIEQVVAACAVLSASEAGPLLALLRRYEAEAAREAARQAAGVLATGAAAALAIEYQPAPLIELDPEDLRDAA